MKLTKILEKISDYKIFGNTEINIMRLSQDSREVDFEDTLYFAVHGTQVDGHDFIPDLYQKKVAAIICEHLPKELSDNVTYIQVQNSLEVMKEIVPYFFGNPSEKIKVLATTGTNGKTTIATILYQSLLGLGKKAALFSTAGDYINGEFLEIDKKASSSMEMIEFQSLLKTALDRGCEYACIEATSHALDQGRMGEIKIDTAIFTNLTQDHLDYHKTMSHYAKSKKKLFDMLGENSKAIVNIDDSYGAFIVSGTRADIFSYGDKNFNNVISRDYLFDVEGLGLLGTKVLFNELALDLPFIGNFNMYNILAAYVTLEKLGFSVFDIKAVLENVSGAKGRMEVVSGDKKKGVIGIVDYAHTPDALRNVLKTLVDVDHANIISVVGAGGDRDRTKRPLMAKAAQEFSDYVIFTSDNPRTEDPKQILSDMINGLESDRDFECIQDRSLAIKKATELAQSGDIILIAGKGHEEYQEVMGKKNFFSDQLELKKYL